LIEAHDDQSFILVCKEKTTMAEKGKQKILQKLRKRFDKIPMKTELTIDYTMNKGLKILSRRM